MQPTKFQQAVQIILQLLMYLAVGANLFFGAYMAALPAGTVLPVWVVPTYAGFNAIMHALPSDGLPLQKIVSQPVAKVIFFLIMLFPATVLLVSCTLGQTQSTIAGLEVGLASAETGASYYTGLPPCANPRTSTPCADPAIVLKIRQADNDAYNAIKQAEATAKAGGAPDMIALQASLGILQNLVAQLPKPTPTASDTKGK